MLQLPDDPFATIELVHDPAQRSPGPGTGISHLVIQVESLDAALAGLAPTASRPGRPGFPAARTDRGPAGSAGLDGYRIELVQWAAGHADGITRADFA